MGSIALMCPFQAKNGMPQAQLLAIRCAGEHRTGDGEGIRISAIKMLDEIRLGMRTHTI